MGKIIDRVRQRERIASDRRADRENPELAAVLMKEVKQCWQERALSEMTNLALAARARHPHSNYVTVGLRTRYAIHSLHVPRDLPDDDIRAHLKVLQDSINAREESR